MGERVTIADRVVDPDVEEDFDDDAERVPVELDVAVATAGRVGKDEKLGTAVAEALADALGHTVEVEDLERCGGPEEAAVELALPVSLLDTVAVLEATEESDAWRLGAEVPLDDGDAVDDDDGVTVRGIAVTEAVDEEQGVAEPELVADVECAAERDADGEREGLADADALPETAGERDEHAERDAGSDGAALGDPLVVADADAEARASVLVAVGVKLATLSAEDDTTGARVTAPDDEPRATLERVRETTALGDEELVDVGDAVATPDAAAMNDAAAVMLMGAEGLALDEARGDAVAESEGELPEVRVEVRVEDAVVDDDAERTSDALAGALRVTVTVTVADAEGQRDTEALGVNECEPRLEREPLVYALLLSAGVAEVAGAREEVGAADAVGTCVAAAVALADAEDSGVIELGAESAADALRV